jgi:hypothetical protein
LARALGGLGLAAALLAGCSDDPAPAATVAASTAPAPTSASGSSTPSPTASEASVADVYRAARTASLSADSGHAKGEVTRDGARLGVDVEGRANGSNQTVFITTPDGGTAEVLTVGDGYWVGGDEAYWAQATGDPTRAASLVGKYAPIMETDATELGSFSLRSLLTDAFSRPELTVLESDTGAAPQTQVDGRAAYVLGQEAGPRIWVAADGSGTLLRVVGPKSDPVDLTFSDWGRARTFGAPAAADLLEN